VTVGVINAEGRPFVNIPGRQQRMLQTDAAINPGNSGGPLLNLRGEVIGINTAIFSGSPRMGNLGIGFAVPIDVVKDLLPHLREGKVTRGRIGVQVSDVPPAAAKTLGLDGGGGALVSSVDPGGPAQEAGLRPGDVFVRYDDAPVTDTEGLVNMVSATPPGTTVPVRVIRDGKPLDLEIGVEELTIGAAAQASRDADTTGGFGLRLRDQRPGGDRAGAPAGPVVTEIVPRSPAAESAIRAGDIILEVNRKRVNNAAEAVAAFRAIGPERVALVLISRDGQEIFLTMNAAR
jgi:serine protease Do